MSPPTFTKSGAKSNSPAKLDRNLFAVEVKNHELIKQAYLARLASKRSNFAVTKTRGLVRGGGRKPIQQKGTGNARVGSTRNPIWRGGGVAFGPTGIENYKIKLSKNSKRTALKQILSLANKEDRLIIIDSISIGSGKTKDAQRLIVKIKASGRILIAVEENSVEKLRPFKNLKDVQVIRADQLNVFDISNADMIVFEKAALDILSTTFGDKK